MQRIDVNMIWCLEFRMNTFSFLSCHFNLAALRNLDLFLGLVACTLLNVLDLVDNIPSFKNLAKYHVLSIQPRGHRGGDEELH